MIQRAPFAPGSTNTVVLTIKDSKNVAISSTNTFVGIPYTTLDPKNAVTNVDKTKPGFNLTIWQVDWESNGAPVGGENANNGVSIATAERLLHGDLGPNTADLAQYTGPGKTYVEPKVINYNAASGDLGNYPDDGTVAGGTASPNLPGLPGSAPRESGIDDVAVGITTYIDFPKIGSYRLIFNSDDGFRTTTAVNPAEVLDAQMVGQFDNGRGAADTISWVYVGTPGIYGFRTIWTQGGGGANMEWAAINPDGVKALINDPNTPGALKAYRATTGGTTPAAVSFVDPPLASGHAPTPGSPVVVDITDGSTAVSNIKFNINGTDVTPTVTKSGSVSTAKFTPPPQLLINATNTVIVSFTDGSKQYLGTNTFTTVGGASIPASMAMKAADVDKTKAGFIIHTYQVSMTNNAATSANHPGNSTQIGEIFANQWWGWPNEADLTAFTGPGKSFVETGVINYNGSSGNIGTYLDDGSAGGTAPDMPGINGNPNLPDAGIDDYALEILTVLDLPAGITEMGVNSDDGFRLIVGSGKDAMPLVVGEFNGGRGADNWAFTRFTVNVPTAGLYPFRLVFEEGGGGNNVEWFSITNRWQPNELGKALINGPGGIKAYQYPTNAVGPTYIKSFGPARSSSDSLASVGRAGPDATVSAVIVDGSTPVVANTVGLKVNGTAVTPTVTQATGRPRSAINRPPRSPSAAPTP